MTAHVKYPIGEFSVPGIIREEMLEEAINYINNFPDLLENLIHDIKNIDWEKPYRPEGWNALQLIHHLSDSHTMAYLRYKYSLTEYTPTIKPYDEGKWALLPDVTFDTLNESLGMLRHTHKKWVYLMRHFQFEDWQKEYFHPEKMEYVSLAVTLLMYEWHAKHHLEHLKIIINKDI